jgi:O-antigen/teichoic acid export membrane protein
LTRAAAAIFKNLETRLQTGPCWLRNMLLDRFFQIGTLLFLATLASNLLSFLFQVTMGRMLTPADYGTMNALLSTFMIAAIPFTTISMVLTREVSFHRAKGQLASVRRLFYWTYKRVGTVGLPALAVFLLLSPAVRQFLRIDTTTPVILLGAVIFLAVSFPVNLAFLGGLQNFVPMRVTRPAEVRPLRALCRLGFGSQWGVHRPYLLLPRVVPDLLRAAPHCAEPS